MRNRYKLALVLAALLIALFVMVNHALAVEIPRCAPRAEMLRLLYQAFGEQLVGHGLALSGAILEITASETGTWTSLATTPEQTCILESGQGWEQMIPGQDA